METHYCSYAVYDGKRRVLTKFCYDPSDVEKLFFEKYFRWNRKGFLAWKNWKEQNK